MIEEIILKYALQNAIRFDGRANQNAVLGKLIQENLAYKKQLPEIKPKLIKIIAEVNSLTIEQQRAKLELLAPELLIDKVYEKKHKLPELKNAVNGRVIMRFEPSPSGPLHIGHAYVLALNSEYCRLYDGKLILRIADTNPNNIYKPSYKLIEEDANWVTNRNISEVIIQSERMQTYYNYMENLLELGYAYICNCDIESYKRLLIKNRACPCRGLSNKEQILRWKGMLSNYKEGSAVARLKTDLQHKNPAMRDFPLFRIVETPHPLQGSKYRVWPLMNMAVAVDDIESNVTHLIRAKDHYDNAIRQKYIFDYLSKPFPEGLFVGRINFIGMNVSCSKTRPLIENGTYTGWDDIRLPFLSALRRRGFQPEAFIRYALEVGVTLNDKTVSKEDFFKSIEAFNKDLIDNTSYRYFFVENPIKITIDGSPIQEIELDLHPDNKKLGRKFKTASEFYISEVDYKKIKNMSLCRLMDCLNFVKNDERFFFDSLDYNVYKSKGELIIHWLPTDNNLIKTEVIMQDNSIITGVSENGISELSVGTIVQFTRFGFCRLDEIMANKFIFRFAHR